MTLRVRLLFAFVVIATLVAINGVSGIVAVSGISDRSNRLINGKFETQRLTFAARQGTQQAIAMSGAYVSQPVASEFHANLLQKEIEESAAAIRSIDEPGMAEMTAASLDHHGAFAEAVGGLLDSHTRAVAYEFEFEGSRYDIASFVEYIAFSLSVWMHKLEYAAERSESFDENLDPGKSLYARWRQSFQTTDDKLAARLTAYERINVELHERARQFLEADSSERSHLHEVLRTYTLADANRTLQDIHTFVAPMIAASSVERASNLKRVEDAAFLLQQDLEQLRLAVVTDLDEAKREMAASQKRYSLTFVMVTVLSFVVALVGGVVLSGSIAKPIRELSDGMREVAAGNLSAGLKISGQGEVAELGRSFDLMRSALRDLVSNLTEGVGELSVSSGQIATTAKESAALASEQAATVTQVSATTEQMRQTADATVANASEVVAASEDASGSGRSGVEETQEVAEAIASLAEQVDEVARRILHLSEQSSRIGAIVTQVNDIAEQSNLLAVNASIEASKAGEQGRGFGVVATEIRKLAEESKHSTNQIRAILEDIERATASSVMVTEEATKRAMSGREKVEHLREVIEKLADALDENAGMAQQIEAATHQSAAGIQQVAQAMDAMRQASGDGARGAEELERSVTSISALAQRLEAATAQYAL